MSAGSSTLTGWALAILGATVAGIVGSKYLRPVGKVRYLYLLFVPGWLLLGLSIYSGEMVVRRLIAAAFADTPALRRDIAMLMNSDYAAQRLYLQFALLTFACCWKM